MIWLILSLLLVTASTVVLLIRLFTAGILRSAHFLFLVVSNVILTFLLSFTLAPEVDWFMAFLISASVFYLITNTPDDKVTCSKD
jgi:hypothetical protein